MRRKFEVLNKGKRYWATLGVAPNGKTRMTFWSSHKWPFYHGHYTPDVIEREDCWKKFMAWLPFKRGLVR